MAVLPQQVCGCLAWRRKTMSKLEKYEALLGRDLLIGYQKERLKKLMRVLPDGNILTVPFDGEEEEPHAIRTRKRLNSYGERAAALMR